MYFLKMKAHQVLLVQPWLRTSSWKMGLGSQAQVKPLILGMRKAIDSNRGEGKKMETLTGVFESLMGQRQGEFSWLVYSFMSLHPK